MRRPEPDDGRPRRADRLRANFGGQELELDFPCRWTYTIIGADEARMRSAVADIVGDRDHSLALSNESRGGRYRSLSLEVVVADDEQRLRIFASLRDHTDIRYVL